MLSKQHFLRARNKENLVTLETRWSSLSFLFLFCTHRRNTIYLCSYKKIPYIFDSGSIYPPYVHAVI